MGKNLVVVPLPYSVHYIKIVLQGLDACGSDKNHWRAVVKAVTNLRAL